MPKAPTKLNRVPTPPPATPQHPVIGTRFSSSGGQPLSVTGMQDGRFDKFEVHSSSPIGLYGYFDQYQLLDLLEKSKIWEHGTTSKDDPDTRIALEQLESIRNTMRGESPTCYLAMEVPLKSLRSAYLKARYFSR